MDYNRKWRLINAVIVIVLFAVFYASTVWLMRRG